MFANVLFIMSWPRLTSWVQSWPLLTCVHQCLRPWVCRLHHSDGAGQVMSAVQTIVSRPLQMLHFLPSNMLHATHTCFAYTILVHFNFTQNLLWMLFDWVNELKDVTVDLINNRLIHFLVWLDSSWRMYVKVHIPNGLDQQWFLLKQDMVVVLNLFLIHILIGTKDWRRWITLPNLSKFSWLESI